MNTTRIFKSHLSVFIAAIMAIGFSSCEQLEIGENPQSVNLAPLPYTNISEMELGRNGAFGRYWNANRQTTYHVAAYAGDDITTHRASNKADFREYDKRAITVGNTRLSTNWNRCYEAIRAINTVLVNIEGIELTEKAKQDRYVGEMHFLRGVLFLHLTRMYGTIPLVLDIVPDTEIQLNTQLEVYNQIESDFLQAESLLPAKTNPGTTEPSAGAARALLARLYLDWAGFQGGDASKYTAAASSAKTVIDNADSHGYALVPDMSTLYTLAGTINTESVFSVGFCDACGRPNTKYGKLGITGDFGGWQETFAEIRFFEDMPEGPRKDATYHTEVPVEVTVKGDGSSEYTLLSNPDDADIMMQWEEFGDQKNPIFRKIVGPFEDNVFNGFRTTRADYLMRYAEVLLIYAEASGRSGNVTADAWEALNKVKRRAAGLPVDTPDPSIDVATGDIAELAFEEKKWELAGEYLRWYDLVRMERVEEALGGTGRTPQVSVGTDIGGGNPSPLSEASNPTAGSTGTDNYFSFIPPSEVDQLPGLQRASPYDPK